jgi:hypothetical protein
MHTFSLFFQHKPPNTMHTFRLISTLYRVDTSVILTLIPVRYSGDHRVKRTRVLWDIVNLLHLAPQTLKPCSSTMATSLLSRCAPSPSCVPTDCSPKRWTQRASCASVALPGSFGKSERCGLRSIRSERRLTVHAVDGEQRASSVVVEELRTSSSDYSGVFCNSWRLFCCNSQENLRVGLNA